MITRLTESLDFHSQALMLRAERQRVLAGNVANADTPGYQARDFDFSAALRQATGAAGRGNGNSSNSSNSSKSGNSGIGGAIARDVMSAGTGGRFQPTLRYATTPQTNLDSNSVDMDRERAALAINAVQYESTLRFINASIRTTLEAMKSPNQS